MIYTRIVIAVQRWMEERKKMADYIDRNAAIEALRKFADDCPGSTEAATAAATAISVLSRVPGPWVEVKDGLPKAENEVLALCDRNGFQLYALRFMRMGRYWNRIACGTGMTCITMGRTARRMMITMSRRDGGKTGSSHRMMFTTIRLTAK